MKRSCPFCGVKFKGKELSGHIYKKHSGEGEAFYCREDCVRCCTDEGAPLELLIGDIKRISKELDMSPADFFRIYGGVLWSNIPGTRSLIPSTGLPFPCKLLKEGRCTIYDVRPLHCRLFPERLFMTPDPQSLEPFLRAGYVCVDEGVYLDDERKGSLSPLMGEDQRGLMETARFFENEKYMHDLSPDEHQQVLRGLKGISPNNPERNSLKRRLIEGVIPVDVKERAYSHFLSKLMELDDKAK